MNFNSPDAYIFWTAIVVMLVVFYAFYKLWNKNRRMTGVSYSLIVIAAILLIYIFTMFFSVSG